MRTRGDSSLHGSILFCILIWQCHKDFFQISDTCFEISDGFVVICNELEKSTAESPAHLYGG